MNSPNQSVIYGHNKYTQIELGNINILISVPHDGFLRPVYLYIYAYIIYYLYLYTFILFFLNRFQCLFFF